MTDAPRYAIYFAPPPGSALFEFGRAWLGRDWVTGELVAQPAHPGIAEVTAFPRLYGFHATLKPPFALAGAEAELIAAVEALAASIGAFNGPPLELASVDGFLALVLSAPSPAMQALADRAVAELDHFRRQPTQEELARRRAAGLSASQEILLRRWGYPYVMGEFRFHMTLTGRLAEPEHSRFRAILEPLVAPLTRAPLPVRSLDLFRQPGRSQPFLSLRSCPLRPADRAR